MSALLATFLASTWRTPSDDSAYPENKVPCILAAQPPRSPWWRWWRWRIHTPEATHRLRLANLAVNLLNGRRNQLHVGRLIETHLARALLRHLNHDVLLGIKVVLGARD